MKILSVAEMRDLEKAADAAGHTYDKMMELAGQGVARAILEHLSNNNARTTGRGIRECKTLVLVGPGNNGGDGLVAARYLSDAGASVTAYLSKNRDPQEDKVLKLAMEHGVSIVTYDDDKRGRELCKLLPRVKLLIDALLGTGAQPPVKGTIADILKHTHETLETLNVHPLTILNRLPEPTSPLPLVVAVDGPSGMDFDTGAADPLTLCADLTVTFANPKRGHFEFPATALSGTLIVADIGIPSQVRPPEDAPEVLTAEMVQQWLPPRPANAHKGTFGKALIVAGSINYTGAAGLSAIAAVRSGTGLVTLGLAGALHDAVTPLVPEATYLILPHVLGALTADAVPVLEKALAGYQALLIGPGLGQAPETAAFITTIFGSRSEKRAAGFLAQKQGESSPPASKINLPLIMDADGLNILSQFANWAEMLPKETILTPHPGEMARLTGKSPAEIQANRWQTARDCATTWKHIVVLKGAFTVIAAPDGRTVMLPFANPGLASAGTGDVLAGVIVGLRAQGLGAFEAAAAGAYIHGMAGEIAREAHGDTGVTAQDVARLLPEAFKRLRGQ